MFETDSFSAVLQGISSRFQGLFDSPGEMTFYVFCLIILHMILIHLFYDGGPGRRRYMSLNLKRSMLILFVVAEIFLFSNLLTFEHFTDRVQPPTLTPASYRY